MWWSKLAFDLAYMSHSVSSLSLSLASSIFSSSPASWPGVSADCVKEHFYVEMPHTTCSNAHTLTHMHLSLCVPPKPCPLSSPFSSPLLFLCLFQKLQCGPRYGQSDGATLRLWPDLHHREDHLCFLPPKAGGAEVPSQPEGGGRHAQVQTPGQISGEGTDMQHSLSLSVVCLGFLLQQWFDRAVNMFWHLATGSRKRHFTTHKLAVCLFFSVTPMIK